MSHNQPPDGRRPLLLLHGGGPGVDAQQNWAPVRERLSSRFEVMAPDLLGFGSSLGTQSEGLHGPTAWAHARAEQVIAILDTIGFDKVSLVGNSAGGGATALRLLSRHPERFDRAVLMGGAGTGGMPTVVPFYGSPTPESMYRTLATLVADETRQRPLLEQMTVKRLEAALRPGAEAAFRSMYEPDPEVVEIAFDAITAPVLVLHGASDRVNPVQVSQRLATRLPHGRLEVVENAGHWIHVDQPEVFCSLVENFLEVGPHAN